MSKHTPGPWEQVPQIQGGPIIAHKYETGRQLNPTGLRLVCHVLQRGSSLREDEANARLIAAAPELLEALKELLVDMSNAQSNMRDAAKRDPRWEGCAEAIQPRVDRACAAIAKAEGL